MNYLLLVGACYLDTILDVDHYPAEDEKLRATKITKRRGGNCPNTLEVLQQLIDPDSSTALQLGLCAVLPSASSQGSKQVKMSFGPSVDLSPCIYRENCDEAACSYILKSRSKDSRTIVNYNDLPEMTSDEFAVAVDNIGDKLHWCHFEGRIPEVTSKCMAYLRDHYPGVKISVEIEKPGRSGLQELAVEADVAFYSKSWAQGNGHPTAESCLKSQSLLKMDGWNKWALLCCTWGERGAVTVELPMAAFDHCKAFVGESSAVVDTIGAGDTFIAGMLHGLANIRNDWPVSKLLSFANELAGRKVAQEGFSGLGDAMRKEFVTYSSS